MHGGWTLFDPIWIEAMWPMRVRAVRDRRDPGNARTSRRLPVGTCSDAVSRRDGVVGDVAAARHVNC